MDANICDHEGTTPLHIAAQRGLMPVVRWLVESRNALVTVADHAGVTPRDTALAHGNFTIAEYLWLKGSKYR